MKGVSCLLGPILVFILRFTDIMFRVCHWNSHGCGLLLGSCERFKVVEFDEGAWIYTELISVTCIIVGGDSPAR